jgi:hypothetical protein
MIPTLTIPYRIVVTGHPLSGKSTYVGALPPGLPRRETDSLLPVFPHKQDWSLLSGVASYWFDEPGPWIISGVAVPRALRHWRRAHPGAKPPLDRFVFISRPNFEGLSSAQIAMAKGIFTVTNSLRPWLANTWIPPNDLLEEIGRPPAESFFCMHRCAYCDSGRRPCVQHGYYRCEFPHARND